MTSWKKWKRNLGLTLMAISIMVTMNYPGQLVAEASLEPNVIHPMNVGDTVLLSLPETSDLQVSRRGLIDLQYTEGVWHVTALRGGFVVLYEKTKSEGDGKRYFIKVNTSEEVRAYERETMDLPLWICSRSGIRCNEKTGVVAGVASSYEWYFKAKDFCSRDDGCFFEVSLTNAGRFSWEGFLKASVEPRFKVQLDGRLMPYITGFCGNMKREDVKKWIDEVTGGAVSKGGVTVRCQEEWLEEKYRVKARIFLIEDNAAQELGLSTFTSASGSASEAKLSFDMRAKLENYLRQNRAEIIGEPVFRVNSGKEAHIASGGEFQSLTSVYPLVTQQQEGGKKASLGWKEHGLQITLDVKPIDMQKVRVRFKCSLKNRNPGEGDQTALQTNSIGSEVDMKLNDPIIMGGVDVSSQGNHESGPLIFDKIPILGPLFKLRSNENQRVRLYLWLIVDHDLGGEDPSRGLKTFKKS